RSRSPTPRVFSIARQQQIDAESAEHGGGRGGLLSRSNSRHRVELPAPVHRSSPATPSKSLWVRWRDRCAALRALEVPPRPPRRSVGFKGSDSLKIACSLQLFSTTLTPLIAEGCSPRLRAPPRETRCANRLTGERATR